jgi:hypothetical protein
LCIVVLHPLVEVAETGLVIERYGINITADDIFNNGVLLEIRMSTPSVLSLHLISLPPSLRENTPTAKPPCLFSGVDCENAATTQLPFLSVKAMTADFSSSGTDSGRVNVPERPHSPSSPRWITHPLPLCVHTNTSPLFSNTSYPAISPASISTDFLSTNEWAPSAAYTLAPLRCTRT